MHPHTPQGDPERTERRPDEWNIYSRELSHVLASHGKTLSSLYQEHCIHPQIVKRLIDALKNPGVASVLSLENNRLVAKSFGFSATERARLRAAILATAMYEILMSRAPSAIAYAIADQAFIILAEHIDEIPFFERATTPRTDADAQVAASPVDALCSEAISIIERAQLALHLGQETSQPNEQVARAWQAYQDFKLASDELLALPPDSQMTETWGVWYGEATQGRQAAQELLER